MNSAILRARLAAILGLPLLPGLGCGDAHPKPETPTEGTATSSSAAATVSAGGTVAPPGSASATASIHSNCKPDEIHERVCGLVDASYEGSGGSAPAPFERCSANGLSLWELQTENVLDGWKVRAHDKVLASFRFDAKHTASFTYTGSYEKEKPRCCYERCNRLDAQPKARAKLPDGAREYEKCVPIAEGTKFPAAGESRCAAALRTRHTFPSGPEDPLDDAPFTRVTERECCYAVASLHRCPPNTFEGKDGTCDMPSPGGRPLHDGDTVVVASTRERAGWAVRAELSGAWPESVRAHAALGWSREAAFEHASVAAFARLAIDLMVHGAPADLVDAAHVAARDEIRHAERCYGIASAFAGTTLGPAPLALGATTTAPTLEALAVECFRDGCVNETVAALSVAEASRRAGTPELRATLAAIAEDEARHAELSYRILAWALREGGPALGVRIGRELDVVRAELAATLRVAAAPTDLDETTGLLAPRTAADVRREVIESVVLPSTAGLLRQAEQAIASNTTG